MELPFEKTVCRYWKQKLYTLVNREETQEVKLPDSMPDVGRVISAWGQVILRSKEWRSDSVGLSGGVMVWVLYAPEDGGGLQRIESWIPFQCRADLPESGEDGTIRAECVLRSVDARNLSSRKLMVRVGVGVLVQALMPEQAELYAPGELPADIEQLERCYPMVLTRETGEKTFQADEELEAPDVAQLVYYRMSPIIQEQKVLGSRAAFRGLGNLHVLYLNGEGKLAAADFEVPFAQYIDLDMEYGDDAEMSGLLCLTGLELDAEEGRLRLKAGLVCQYIINSRSVFRILGDAYSPCRRVELVEQELAIPSWLESLQEMVDLEQTIPTDDGALVDQIFLPELPVVSRQPGAVEITSGGVFQTVTRNGDGSYAGRNQRTSQSRSVPTASDTVVFSRLDGPVRSRREGGGWKVEARQTLEVNALGAGPVPMVTGIRAGEPGTPDPDRPSVIVRAVGEAESLWDIAKYCGSTVSAIQRLNKLESEPAENRLLLIPVI